MSLAVQTDDVTKGRKDVDLHGRFRGEWVKVKEGEVFSVSKKRGEHGNTFKESTIMSDILGFNKGQ